MTVDRETRDKLADALVRFMKGEADSRALTACLDGVLAGDTTDEGAAAIAMELSNYCRDGAPHPISVSDAEWQYLRRIVAFLLGDLTMESRDALAIARTYLEDSDSRRMMLPWNNPIMDRTNVPAAQNPVAPFTTEADWDAHEALLEPLGLSDYDPDLHCPQGPAASERVSARVGSVDRQARDALARATARFMKGRGESVDLGNEIRSVRATASNDPSVLRIARQIATFYEDGIRHGVSVSEDEWEDLTRLVAFLRTDLEFTRADENLIGEFPFTPFRGEDEWEQARPLLDAFDLPPYDVRVQGRAIRYRGVSALLVYGLLILISLFAAVALLVMLGVGL